MRLSKMILISLVFSVIIILAPGCASEMEPVVENRELTVQRGDLRVDIIGVGNLVLSQKVDLAFEIEGTVDEVIVEEADFVEEGQVLAKLVMSEWEDQLTVLEDKVISTERNKTAKERAVTAAERGVTDAERGVTDAERGVTDAEREVTDAEREVTDAEREVADAEQGVTDAERQVISKELDLLQAQINLNNAKLTLEEIEETSTDRLKIEAKELELEIAEQRLVDAQIAVEDATTIGLEDARLTLEDTKVALGDARIAVEDAQIAVEDAQKAVEDAGKDFDEAQNMSPEVTATFSGFITKVNVSGGDEVKNGTVAVTLADPSKFEADIFISELDILQIKLAGEAQVNVDAIPGTSLPAEVTHISPTATIQQGVVNYNVKVALKSLDAMTKQQQVERQETQSMRKGELPERLKQAVEEGRVTQEQAESMMQQRQQGQSGQQRQMTTKVMPENFQLREGLTVTVSINVVERVDVLLVPNMAISTQGGQSFVQVPDTDGTVEQRVIQTGISDFQFTEVTGGLSEGEQIIVPEGTSAATTTTQQTGSSRGMFIPGLGRSRR